MYNGINVEVFNPDNVDGNLRGELGLKDDTVILGSIGALEEDKGQRYLFEAITRLKLEGINNIKCIVCGTGPHEKELKKVVHENGLSNEILFLGFRSDIRSVFKILDILVVTSLTIEACSMTMLEAQAMMLPIIATNISGNPELIVDNSTGILIPPGDADSLRDALKYLIQNLDVRHKMGKNGRFRVLEKFTIEQNVRKTEKIFLEMVQDSIVR